MAEQRWLPLEANPDVMNQLLGQLGMLPSWLFGDVYSLDEDVLCTVPRPVCAVLLLFPITEVYEAFKLQEEEKIATQGQGQGQVPVEVYFIKQTIGNACGTIGLLHAVANNRKQLEFKPDSPLKSFLDKSLGMSPEDKAALLEKAEGIHGAHESCAQEGQTRAPSAAEKQDKHFIALVNVGGVLYELDGRKPFPVVHGKTSEEKFLEDAIAVCKTFMARDPEEVGFSVVALSKAL